MNWTLVAHSACWVLGLMTLLWLVSVWRRDASVVDPWWSMAFLLVTVHTTLRTGLTPGKTLLLAVVAVLTVALMAATPWCALGFLAVPLAWRAAAPVRAGRGGRNLIPVLRDTGLTMLVWSAAVSAALSIAA